MRNISGFTGPLIVISVQDLVNKNDGIELAKEIRVRRGNNFSTFTIIVNERKEHLQGAIEAFRDGIIDGLNCNWEMLEGYLIVTPEPFTFKEDKKFRYFWCFKERIERFALDISRGIGEHYDFDLTRGRVGLFLFLHTD